MRATLHQIINGSVRLCETEVDGIYCYRTDVSKDADGMWGCAEHAETATTKRPTEPAVNGSSTPGGEA